uniref:tRNA-2-methylthio-N(6)-dimethylallyladenosine synthase n=1 Tax=Candidatus Komeilibacteria bacterium CG_4_10_14_0_8_um_filter_37_78 TaxID=1974471 RepID=A0A2M7RDX2_9BACT|nr:MAG: tRNA (N6-isopentenyl adenosine(37)-C2)-methylthiotransferase MiaB [Candidatus Komeilibacteria bacterium CG_4_10_14_0_8_um_filter_37_78]
MALFCYSIHIMSGKLKYYQFVLGCQMNKSDSERIAGVLNDLDYQQVDNETDVDLIIVVACSVRQSAIDRIYGKLRQWNKIKKQRPLVTAITGCLLPGDKKKMKTLFDLSFDITELAELPKLLQKKSSQLFDVKEYFDLHPTPESAFQIYIPIMTGCNNFCTYCAVPYVRGREKSRTSRSIIIEVKEYIDKGYKEITLLGQNVNSYGLDLPNELTFPELLKEINDLPGDWWLRFVTSHPKDMSDELIDILATEKHLCEYVHLPIQAGDNETLASMNRKYTVEHYTSLVEKIREKIPKTSLSTDIIVGFPGETPKQFKNTVKVFKSLKFDMAYISKFSPRAGTVAANLADNISPHEKKKREKKLTKVLDKYAVKFNKQYIGQTLTVLIEKSVKKDNHFELSGKTRSFKTTRCNSQKDLKGQFVNIKIAKATAYGLEGVIDGN